MSWFTQTLIENCEGPVRSLCWRGDELVDWVRGEDRWTLDGRFAPARRDWGYNRFDGAVADPSGRWAVVYEQTGTAALLLRDGQIVRPIHRSPYHADAFLYPICLFHFADRALIAHCPDSYSRIEIEDAETGARLTRCPSRVEADIFHSRLAVSPGSKRLLSAGWIWHPVDVVVPFDIATAIADPTHLDVLDAEPFDAQGEPSSACWLDDDRIVLGGSDQTGTVGSGPERVPPNGLAVLDLRSRAWSQSVDLGSPPGTMMPVGPSHVVTFFGHPRLVSLATGIVHEWTKIDSGNLVSSIVPEELPVIGLDPARARFAVAGPLGIDVVTIDVAALDRAS